MGDMTSEGANIGAGIDLSQFYQVFFEESSELLAEMENLLLKIGRASCRERVLTGV